MTAWRDCSSDGTWVAIDIAKQWNAVLVEGSDGQQRFRDPTFDLTMIALSASCGIDRGLVEWRWSLRETTTCATHRRLWNAGGRRGES